MSKKFILIIACLIYLPAFAQEPETFSYSSKDGLFSFEYPTEGWVLAEDYAGQISFANSDDALLNAVQKSGDVLGTFFTPAYLARFSGITFESTTADVLAIVLASAEYTQPERYPLPDALQATTQLENGQRLAVAVNTGHGIALVLVDTWGEEAANYEDVLFQMIGSAHNASAVAMPLAQTFTAPEGLLQFSYPTRWVVTASAEPNTYFFANSEQAAGSYVGTNGVLQGTVYPPEFLTDSLGFEPDASLLEVAVEIPQIFTSDITFQRPDPMTVGTRSAYITSGMNGTDVEAYIYIIETENGIGLMLFAAPLVELIQYEPTFEAMLATLQFDVPLDTVELAEISVDTPLDGEYTLENETLTFAFPETWAAAEMVEGTAYLANSLDALDRSIVAAPPAAGELQILLLSSAFIEAQEIEIEDDPLRVAQTVIDTLFSDTNFQFSPPFQVEGSAFIQWEAVNAEVETIGYLIPLEDGVAVMFSGAPSGEMFAYRAILLKIAESVRQK